MKQSKRYQLTLADAIVRTIDARKPQNVQQLLNMLRERTIVPEKVLLECIIDLQSERKILLKNPYTPHTTKLRRYLLTSEANWYWSVTLLVTVTVLSVFTISEDAFPLVYLRYALGLVFALWLPGHSLVRALFPGKSSIKEARSLHFIDRIVLSIGTSIALVAMTGLLLSYTPWGIRLEPLLLSLLSLSEVFATAGVLREYRVKIRSSFRKERNAFG